MKKLGLLALVSAAFASFASAAACSGGSFGGIDLFQNGNALLGAPATITCTIDAGAGNYITGVTVNTISDYSNPSAGATVSLQITNFTSTLGGLGVLVPTAFTLSGLQVVSTTGATNANTALQSLTVTFNSAFVSQVGTVDAATVNANGLNSSTGGACVASATQLGCSANNGFPALTGFQSGIFFTSATVPPSSVPEPATLSLMGGALIALGLFSRKRK